MGSCESVAMADVTTISYKALQAPWAGVGAGYSPRQFRSEAQKNFSFHFTAAECAASPLPASQSNFRNSVECRRDATVNPHVDAIDLPDPSSAPYYCRHISLPHN